MRMDGVPVATTFVCAGITTPLALRSSTPPLSVKVVAVAPSAFACVGTTVPAFSIKPPEKVLFPPRVKVPVPVLISLPIPVNLPL